MIAAFLSSTSALARTAEFRFPFQDTTIIEESASEVERNRYFLNKDEEGASMDSLVIRQVPGEIINAYKADEDYIYPARKEETNIPAKTESRKIIPKRKKVEQTDSELKNPQTVWLNGDSRYQKSTTVQGNTGCA